MCGRRHSASDWLRGDTLPKVTRRQIGIRAIDWCWRALPDISCRWIHWKCSKRTPDGRAFKLICCNNWSWQPDDSDTRHWPLGTWHFCCKLCGSICRSTSRRKWRCSYRWVSIADCPSGVWRLRATDGSLLSQSLSAQCEGAPVPLVLENGTVIPPANLTDLPYCVQFKLKNSPSHLRPYKVVTNKVDNGPFLFTPIHFGSIDRRTKKNDGKISELSLHCIHPENVNFNFIFFCSIPMGPKRFVRSLDNAEESAAVRLATVGHASPHHWHRVRIDAANHCAANNVENDSRSHRHADRTWQIGSAGL